jgi:hypothetical protein
VYTCNVIWLSKYAPTVEQAADLEANGFRIVALAESMALGGMAINDQNDLEKMVSDLADLVCNHEAVGIYGVFSAPFQSMLSKQAADTNEPDDTGIPCYESWCATPSTHRKFVWVGTF